MYKYIVNSIRKALFFSCILFSFVFLIFPVSAQSVDDLSLTLSIDKPSINPGDTFSVNYSLQNKSTNFTAYNIKTDFKYIDNISNVTFASSTTGISKDDLRNNGYIIPSLSIGKSISFSLVFQLSPTAQPNTHLTNSIDNSSTIKSTITYYFSQDTNTPKFSKDVSANFPQISQPKPQIASIKYPTGIMGYDLSQLDNTSVKSLTGFYLQAQNEITYNTALDLSTPEALTILQNIPTYFDLNSTDSIKIKDNNTFNKKATVVLNKSNFIDKPKVFKNGTLFDTNINFDKENKKVQFDVDGTGTYTLMPILNIQIPPTFTTSIIDLQGSISNPTDSITAIIDGKTYTAIPVDITNGNFTIHHEFTSPGSKSIEIDVVASTGDTDKNMFSTQYAPDITSSTPPKTLPPSTNDPNYVKDFLLTILGITLLGLIVGGILTYITIKKRNKILSTDTPPSTYTNLEVKSYNSEGNTKDTVSENRHEVIVQKIKDLEKNKNDI